MMQTDDIIGRQFGFWRVISLAYIERRKPFWKCQCGCGTISIVDGYKLESRHSKSCGCQRPQILAAIQTTHGQATRGHVSREYNSWAQMKSRCYNPKNVSWKHYGKRGVEVCERWMDSFENFFTDMGRKPGPEYSIDRIDNDGNYEPSNCQWATPKQQRSNQGHRRVA